MKETYFYFLCPACSHRLKKPLSPRSTRVDLRISRTDLEAGDQITIDRKIEYVPKVNHYMIALANALMLQIGLFLVIRVPMLGISLSYAVFLLGSGLYIYGHVFEEPGDHRRLVAALIFGQMLKGVFLFFVFFVWHAQEVFWTNLY